MKVCLFADFPLGALDRVDGGRGAGQMATWLPQLARAWASSEGMELHWCVFSRETPRQRRETRWGQTFHILPGGRITTGLASMRLLPRMAFRSVIRDLRPDLIHCWGTEHVYSSALWEFSGPGILSMQGILSECWKTGGLKGWRWRLMKAWEPPALRRARIVTSESEWGLARVRELVPGVSTRRIEYGVEDSFYDQTWSPTPDAPRLLFAGSLSRIKGFDILLDMLTRHRRLNWRLVVAGDGPMAAHLRDLNHPCVDVLGVVTTRRIQQEMARAWALVLCSRADTCPNVVKEARVIGLPVVVSPHGGHAEYVEDGRDGWVVRSGDPEDWFAALNRVCSDFQALLTMGRARREFFRDHFRPEHTATAFQALYRELAGAATAS